MIGKWGDGLVIPHWVNNFTLYRHGKTSHCTPINVYKYICPSKILIIFEEILWFDLSWRGAWDVAEG
jgi:hypothetical protein